MAKNNKGGNNAPTETTEAVNDGVEETTTTETTETTEETTEVDEAEAAAKEAEELAAKEAAKTATKPAKFDGTVSHEGKTYKCTIPRFSYNKKLYTAEELQDKPKLVAELVEIKFAGLVLVP